MTSYVFSTDASNPLRITDNAYRGISAYSAPSMLNVCLRNIAFAGNDIAALAAQGPYLRVEMNGVDCAFPPEAQIVCNDISYLSCNTFHNNGDGSEPLILAADGARVDINRALLYQNNITSLLSTNLDADPSSAAITMSRSVVLENTVRDHVFEVFEGGIIDIWDSTILGNVGAFGVSIISINPALLQLTNTIVDQPQRLLAHTGNPANARLNRLLAPNQTGTDGLSRVIWTGRPTYADAIGRLSVYSMGVDYAPAGGGVDRDGNPCDVDTLDLPNGFGPRDLGAFEVQQTLTDRIMATGFETLPAVQ